MTRDCQCGGRLQRQGIFASNVMNGIQTYDVKTILVDGRPVARFRCDKCGRSYDQRLRQK